jgi:hypothetical protein
MKSRLRHLRLALGVSAAVLLVAVLVGFLVRGWAGALGAAAGVALVAASYTATTLAIAWADSVNPRMVMPVGMAMYVTKFSLFGAMLILTAGTAWAGRLPLAMGIVAGVVAWTGAQIWWTVHHEHPYVPAVTRK